VGGALSGARARAQVGPVKQRLAVMLGLREGEDLDDWELFWCSQTRFVRGMFVCERAASPRPRRGAALRQARRRGGGGRYSRERRQSFCLEDDSEELVWNQVVPCPAPLHPVALHARKHARRWGLRCCAGLRVARGRAPTPTLSLCAAQELLRDWVLMVSREDQGDGPTAADFFAHVQGAGALQDRMRVRINSNSAAP